MSARSSRGRVPREWLDELEASLVGDPGSENLALAVVLLAAAAGRDVPVDDDEVRGATRRALYLLAAGGDPSRGLDLNGRAVTAVAEDVDAVDRRAALTEGLVDLRRDAAGLAHVSETIHALLDAPDVAWRAYACSLLAEELADLD